MAAKKITVIGAGGGMGRWFSKFFLDGGHEVTGYDSEAEIPTRGVAKAGSLVGAILKADYVVLCTPARRTPEIIRLIAKEMRRGAYLIDISSQKAKTMSALCKVPPKINPVCVHPMFGPGTRRIAGKNVISVPVKDGKKELAVARELFKGANFVTIDASEHDKKMAMILGLTHLVNLAFASIMSKDEKLGLADKMAGVTFKVQRMLAESIMTEPPELIETIISNQEIRRLAEEFWKDVGRLLTDVQEGKTEEVLGYIRACQDRLAESSDPAASYRRLVSVSSQVEK